MVDKEQLKKINFLNDVSDDVLEKIGAIAQLENFDEESILFRQNQKQTLLYMLVSGKVFLNARSEAGKLLTLDEVGPGRSFGVSALMDESSSTFTAVCAENSSIITISGEQMNLMFKEDFRVGRIIMKKVVDSFKRRMDMHTMQFLKTLMLDPEIKQFL